MIPEPAHDAFQLFRIHEMERQPQHKLHAEQEHPQPAEQGQRMRIGRANTPLCLPPRRQKPSDLGSKNSLKL